mmetsp:Transcript_9906/g.10830  ORF Transcript_9906/g.10830 Transcript_9906/m.10830 type:complete len:212 (+) Transcript_9906:161-796(+)
MNSHNTVSHVCIINSSKSSITDQLLKLSLCGEFFNTLNQILVRVSIIGNSLSNHRDHIEIVEFIELLKERSLNFAEFKTHETPTLLENSVSFLQSLISVSYISDTEGNCVNIESVVLERQFLGTSLDEVELTVSESSVPGSVFSDRQHRTVNVHDSDVDGVLVEFEAGITLGLVQYSECNITSSSSHIQNFNRFDSFNLANLGFTVDCEWL